MTQNWQTTLRAGYPRRSGSDVQGTPQQQQMEPTSEWRSKLVLTTYPWRVWDVRTISERIQPLCALDAHRSRNNSAKNNSIKKWYHSNYYIKKPVTHAYERAHLHYIIALRAASLSALKWALLFFVGTETSAKLILASSEVWSDAVGQLGLFLKRRE